MLKDFISQYSAANIFHTLRRVIGGPFSGMKEVCYTVAMIAQDSAFIPCAAVRKA